MEKVRLVIVSLLFQLGLVCSDLGNMSDLGSVYYISLMVSSAPTSNTLEVISAVNTTVENINNDKEFLPVFEFNLQYGARDTQVLL